MKWAHPPKIRLEKLWHWLPTHPLTNLGRRRECLGVGGQCGGWGCHSPHLWTSMKLGVRFSTVKNSVLDKAARPSQSASTPTPHPRKGTPGTGRGLPPDLEALWSSISKEPQPQAMKVKEKADSGGGKWPGPRSPRRTTTSAGRGAPEWARAPCAPVLSLRYSEKAKEKPQMVKPP